MLLKTDSSPDMKEEFIILDVLLEVSFLFSMFRVMIVSFELLFDFAMSDIILASAESIEEDNETTTGEVKPFWAPLLGEPSQVSLIIFEMSSYWSMTSDFFYWV